MPPYLRRAHFARRLLDDTDLSLTDIAFAAGFGSVRQFNRTMQDTFRASPRDLRARRRKADRLVADGGLTLRLRFAPPLDWALLLGWFGSRAVDGAEVVDGETYRRTIVVDSAPGVIEVGPGGEDHLLLRAHLPHWDGLIHVVQQVRRMFGLDHDPATDGRFIEDPTLAALVAQRRGLRVPGSWDGFEVGVRAILGQQVTVTGARTLAGRLVQRLGTPVPGLGDWTAHYLALRIGEADAFPAGDLGLRKALANGSVPTAREAEARAEAWRPWRAQAAIHLWAHRP